MLISDSSGMSTTRRNPGRVPLGSPFGPLGPSLGTRMGGSAVVVEFNKLCLHVGHVLFMRNQRDKLCELKMCPQ